MQIILHTVDVRAARDSLYQAILSPEGLAGWWSTRVTADHLEPGGVVSFVFEEGFNPDMRIEQKEPDHLLSWRCVGGHKPWEDNTFRFELADVDAGHTRLRFQQHYAAELDDDAYGTYNFNWGFYLQSLKELCEAGSGKPYNAA